MSDSKQMLTNTADQENVTIELFFDISLLIQELVSHSQVARMSIVHLIDEDSIPTKNFGSTQKSCQMNPLPIKFFKEF